MIYFVFLIKYVCICSKKKKKTQIFTYTSSYLQMLEEDRGHGVGGWVSNWLGGRGAQSVPNTPQRPTSGHGLNSVRNDTQFLPTVCHHHEALTRIHYREILTSCLRFPRKNVWHNVDN